MSFPKYMTEIVVNMHVHSYGANVLNLARIIFEEKESVVLKSKIIVCMPTPTCIHAYMHTCIHAYMHTCITWRGCKDTEPQHTVCMYICTPRRADTRNQDRWLLHLGPLFCMCVCMYVCVVHSTSVTRRSDSKSRPLVASSRITLFCMCVCMYVYIHTVILMIIEGHETACNGF
jgi:hypothetical protein